MSDDIATGRPLKPLTARQEELLRILQALDPEQRHTVRIVCRGTEPWEVQEIVEHRSLGELKPRRNV